MRFLASLRASWKSIWAIQDPQLSGSVHDTELKISQILHAGKIILSLPYDMTLQGYK